MRVLVLQRVKSAEGFTFMELLIALSLFAAVSVIILQSFIGGMRIAGRASEQAAATTVAMQIMEQIRGSANPYEWVGINDLTRTPVGSLSGTPYGGVVNPTPYAFQVAVSLTRDEDLTLTTAVVQVFRPSDTSAYISLATVLDDQ